MANEEQESPPAHFLRNHWEMLEAAKRCIEQRQHVPALVLMYSHMDALAWMAAESHKNRVRVNFEQWVNAWLLPRLSASSPTLTATDLYAARCGVLHTLTSTSELSTAGHAKQIAYAWGTADAQMLDEALAEAGVQVNMVTVHYQALLDALSDAIAGFFQAAESDPMLRERIAKAAGLHFMHVPARSQDGEQGEPRP